MQYLGQCSFFIKNMRVPNPLIIVFSSLFFCNAHAKPIYFFSMSDKKLSQQCGQERSEKAGLYHSISDVQGRGSSSPLNGQQVVIEGVVTLSLQGRENYRGFWLQEKIRNDLKTRMNNSTSPIHVSLPASQGIFIYHSKKKVKQGQVVRVLGRVAEFNTLTEVKSVNALAICKPATRLPIPVNITLPVSSLRPLEALEGMRVSLSQELVVSDFYGTGYGLGNNGQFAVSTQLHYQPTELYTSRILMKNPSVMNAKKHDYLLIDDGSNKRYPSFIPFPNQQGFSANNSFKIGDKVRGVGGILHAYKDKYIIIPDFKNTNLTIIPAQLDPSPIIDKRSNLVIASMNLGNYFNGSTDGSIYKKGGFQASRGARNYLAFGMQTKKIVAALHKMNADVIALMELENDGYEKGSSIATLTRALNLTLPIKDQYRYVIPSYINSKRKKLGDSAISVGLLYKSNALTLAGEAKVLDARSSNNEFNDGLNRPSLLQEFKLKSKKLYSKTEEPSVLVVVNHFKSKGKPCKKTEPTSLQGHCNLTRVKAAKALVKFITMHSRTAGGLPVLILGDFNSYSQEDPLLALYKAGYTNIKNKNQFSYSYQGYVGNLDHALVNDALLPHVRSMDAWNINSVEDVLLDYQTEKTGHSYPSVDHYAEPDERRSSDHDPLVIGLEF